MHFPMHNTASISAFVLYQQLSQTHYNIVIYHRHYYYPYLSLLPLLCSVDVVVDVTETARWMDGWNKIRPILVFSAFSLRPTETERYSGY